MTRSECERKLIELTELAMDIYHQYNPDGQELSLLRQRGGYINVSDIELDPETKDIVCWTIEGIKREDGEIDSLDYDRMTIKREEEST